jgi:actin cytoskeleton-regulatory complex protein SLA1
MPTSSARAIYEYTRQTDEELSFPEEATLQVFDTSDPDWILVGLDGDYGFVPSNYIEVHGEDAENSQRTLPSPPSLPVRPTATASRDADDSHHARPSASASPTSPVNNPAAALASVMAGRAVATRPSPPTSPHSAQNTLSEASDDEDARTPALPTRPRAQIAAPMLRTEPPPRQLSREVPVQSPVQSPLQSPVQSPVQASVSRTPGGFRLYNLNEMVSVMGKRKKMPTTLGINLTTGTILIAPERAQDGPSQEWAADKMTHYSREGKHVFLELVRPSKSVDLHAGAKDTAEEVVSVLGELSGAVRAEGLREVIMAGTGQAQKKGQVLYDFMAQGDDEVTVGVGDEVIVLDDTKSEEWWQVRRLKNGKEGVVPSSYIEVTGTVTPPPSSAGLNAAKSMVEQNRLEEIRLTKEAVKAAHQRDTAEQVGPGMPLPARGSSLLARENGNNSGQQRSKRANGRTENSEPQSQLSQPRSSKSSESHQCSYFLPLCYC